MVQPSKEQKATLKNLFPTLISNCLAPYREVTSVTSFLDIFRVIIYLCSELCAFSLKS